MAIQWEGNINFLVDDEAIVIADGIDYCTLVEGREVPLKEVFAYGVSAARSGLAARKILVPKGLTPLNSAKDGVLTLPCGNGDIQHGYFPLTNGVRGALEASLRRTLYDPTFQVLVNHGLNIHSAIIGTDPNLLAVLDQYYAENAFPVSSKGPKTIASISATIINEGWRQTPFDSNRFKNRYPITLSTYLEIGKEPNLEPWIDMGFFNGERDMSYYTGDSD